MFESRGSVRVGEDVLHVSCPNCRHRVSLGMTVGRRAKVERLAAMEGVQRRLMRQGLRRPSIDRTVREMRRRAG